MKKLITLAIGAAALVGAWCARAELVNYVDTDGTIKQVDATVVVASGSRVTWTVGWYAVTNEVTIVGGAQCSGAVNLILADGAKLTINGVAEDNAGIGVTGEGISFTIYGQVGGTGELDVTGGKFAAGIGGCCNGAGSNITIYGGTVTATGGNYGAGIGGGGWGTGSDITINGGMVTATGGEYGAGIGGGDGGAGSNITINGGTVTATGSDGGVGIGGSNGGAGIGGGDGGAGSGITINGGTVTATGGFGGGAGIGGGDGGAGSDITIGEATIFVRSPGRISGGAGYVADLIGNGSGCDKSAEGVCIADTARIFFNLTGWYNFDEWSWTEPVAPMPESFDGFVIMTPETQTVDRVLVGGLSGLPEGQHLPFALTNAVTGATGTLTINDPVGTEFAGRPLKLSHADGILCLAEVLPMVEVTYVDERGLTQKTNAIPVVASDSRVTWWSGWYVVTNEVTIAGGAGTRGKVNLILADGAKLTINGVAQYSAGISVMGEGNSFTIYAQIGGTGVLNVTGGEFGAGIGGGYEGAGLNITINGGTVTATGGNYGAGIGGGDEDDGSDITINGGKVTANGGYCAAGIGGGYEGAGSGITINGGTVTAMGGYNGAGIGGGISGAGSDITINGGTATATGGDEAAGIGGGYEGAGSDIYVEDDILVRAGDSANPTEVITHVSITTDIASLLAGKQYVTAWVLRKLRPFQFLLK